MALPRVAFYTENYIIGGAERYLADLVEALDLRGYEVTLFSNRNPAFDRYVVSRRLGHIRHRTIPILGPVRHSPRRSLRPVAEGPAEVVHLRRFSRLKDGVKSGWRYATCAPNLLVLRAAFQSRPIDILHINNGGYPAAESCRLAPIAAHRAGVPTCVMTVHNLAQPPAGGVERRIDRCVERRLKAVIGMSQAVAGSMTGNRAFSVRNVRSFDLGIESSPTSPSTAKAFRADLGVPPTARVIGVVGSFEARKGHVYVVRAFEQVLRRPGARDVYLVLVGEGETRAAIAEQVGRAGLTDRVVFAGYRPDAAALASAFDLLVVPSTGFEGQGYVILEAMAQGVPVIASRVGGFSETVDDGVTGLLVSPAETNALASALDRLLLDEQGRRSMGRSGRARYEARFTLRRMIDETVALYSELVAAR